MSQSPLIVAFCCEHSAYMAADSAGRMRLAYPENVQIIKVPCAGRIDVLHILKAFEKGAEGVMVMGCEDGACHHLTGNTRARERVNYSEMLLVEAGINSGRIAMYNLAPNAPHKFVRLANEMCERIRKLEQVKNNPGKLLKQPGGSEEK
jgi:F420-non-reducing hydrogenase iron-sulfur subunit